MMMFNQRLIGPFVFVCLCGITNQSGGIFAEETVGPAAEINGSGPGWRQLGQDDFENVNCDEDTWSFEDSLIRCTGKPTGVMRTKERFTNFELVAEWRHLKKGGNSGIFVWATDDSIEQLKKEGKPGLPHGIEVQVLDTGYREVYEKRFNKVGDWFTSHGDVFPVKTAKMTPFPPLSPNGSRSFPSEDRVKPTGEWNHYYVRAINGEIRLWVNGKEVSGGTDCDPAVGCLCLESEGAPVEFRGLKIRTLP
ncbi:3-keto-disaccharide hydrolase [Calycomorphotria hydatis]|uniref:3-keto-alpha-glucoside-1,2-lyase/3-keto-2-hydroxy-glucal hydratase domain-containing protein n=1 Tax=Calycomorphotria hydatis TaxID=2528027 RepID=A0A517TD02_9PLAN|nr:DUF1080 domain-containing protein [Calycomorphotria hydatis]QDT66238.1 hypothetical protein V22_35030 [Calycomorphotria hydatis]